jgi:hypothetical protein
VGHPLPKKAPATNVTKKMYTFRPFALTIFVFGLLFWLYAVAVQIMHPRWVYGPFSHIPFPPFNWRLDDLGIVAFALSAFGFFVWQLEESDMKR